MQIPSVGRVVHYRRSHAGAPPLVSEPAIITYVHSDTCVNLQVFCDAGPPHSVVYVTSACLGDGPAQWSWPPHVPPRVGEAAHR